MRYLNEVEVGELSSVLVIMERVRLSYARAESRTSKLKIFSILTWTVSHGKADMCNLIQRKPNWYKQEEEC